MTALARLKTLEAVKALSLGSAGELLHITIARHSTSFVARRNGDKIYFENSAEAIFQNGVEIDDILHVELSREDRPGDFATGPGPVGFGTVPVGPGEVGLGGRRQSWVGEHVDSTGPPYRSYHYELIYEVLPLS